MPAQLQSLSIEHQAFIVLVVAAFSVFWLCLLAVWVYMNAGAQPEDDVEPWVQVAVRPSAAEPQSFQKAA